MPSICVPEIFLDANATTPVLPEVAQAIQQVSTVTYGNASSPHLAGLTPKQILQDTRHLASRLFHGEAGRFLFNSGATEGINTAVLSVLRAVAAPQPKQLLLYGATEHKAVPEALKHWNTVLGIHAEVKAIPVDSSGQLNLEFLRQHLPQAIMLCTMGANNETGVVHNLEAIAALRKTLAPQVPWLVDSVQVLGKLSLNLTALEIDYATFSAHKLYGPKGAGCLYVRNGSAFTPLQVGGGQECGERGGTENIAGVLAFQCLFSWLLQQSASPLQPMEVLQSYRERLLHALRDMFPNLVLNQPEQNCLATTINFAVPGYSSGELIAMFDAAGIRVSAGSACSTGRPRSFVLDAMGLPQWQSEGAIRLSFGPAANESFIAQVCKRLQEMKKRLAAMHGNRFVKTFMLPGKELPNDNPQNTPCSEQAAASNTRLLVPAPTEHGYAVFVDSQSRRVHVVAGRQRYAQYEAWLQQRLGAEDWSCTWINPEEYPNGATLVSREAWLCVASPAGFTVINSENQRQLSFTEHGIIITPEQRQYVRFMSVADATAQLVHFIDVRDPLETAMQQLPASAAEPVIAPRALWCEFALTYELPQDSAAPAVTVCRSGGRSATVAAICAMAGGPVLHSCIGGVTHIAEHQNKA